MSRVSDRLDELGFELPVAGGDRPVGAVAAPPSLPC